MEPTNHSTSEDLGPAPRSGGQNLFQIAWERKGFILLAQAVVLVLGVLYYARSTPIYQSEAQVLVVKKRPDEITGMDTRHLTIEDYMSTQQMLIGSPVIIDRAVKKRRLDALTSFQEIKDDPTQDLTEAIKKTLAVSRTKATGAQSNNVLILSFRCTNPAESSTVLNGIIDSYRDYLDEVYRSNSQESLKLITQARDTLQKEIQEQYEAYARFLKEAPLLKRGKEGTTSSQDRLSSIETRKTALALRKAEIQGYLKALENAKANPEALLALLSEWSGRPETETPRKHQGVTLQDQVYQLRLEEQKLLETKGENHPEVQRIRERIQFARDFLASPSSPFHKETTKGGKAKPAADPVALYRTYFQQQLQHVETAEQLLKDLYQQEYNSARALTSFEIQDEKFRITLVTKQKLHDTIVDRLKDVNLIKDLGGYEAKVIAPPKLGKKVSPKGILIFPAALFLGTLAGLGLAYLAEVTDKSFRSVEEVRRRLRLPVVGQVPHLKPAEEGVLQALPSGERRDPLLCAYLRPKSIEAEAYRGIRTSLYFSTRGKGHSLIQITSPSAGDGKSTLAANLAVSIAQSGKQVLLIDADLRKPRLHKMFGVSSPMGLASVILEGTEPADAIQETGINGLSLLPAGPIPPNPAELLTSLRFPEFLAAIRERYDFVLVDTPPLLAVTDPSVVAPRVDGVLLNIRLTKNGRPASERAKDILDTLGAQVLGVVINDSECRTGGNYGYGYGYGYADGYHEGGREDGPLPEKNGQGPHGALLGKSSAEPGAEVPPGN